MTLEEIIMNDEKMLCDEIFEEMCRRIGVESNKSNGMIERKTIKG
jgi:hypothetical protein